MSRAAVYIWPSEDIGAIADTQDLGAAGNLLLNGSLASNNQVVFDSIIRTVSLTSVNDLSAVNFTITGTSFNGQPLSEVLAGPNTDTVYSLEKYASILSIASDSAAAAVSAGSGQTGQTQWNLFNYHSQAFPTLAYQVVMTNTMTCSFQITLDDVSTNGDPFLKLIAPDITASDAGILNFATTRYSCFTIDDGTTDGSAVFTILQQGL